MKELQDVFDSSVLNYSTGELMEIINKLITDNAPEGKTLKDFTGGYIQQLTHSNRFTMFYGQKTGTTNKSTVQLNIADTEVDLMFVMLKAKILDMKNERLANKKVNLTQMLLDNRSKSIFTKKANE